MDRGDGSPTKAVVREHSAIDDLLSLVKKLEQTKRDLYCLRDSVFSPGKGEGAANMPIKANSVRALIKEANELASYCQNQVEELQREVGSPFPPAQRGGLARDAA